MNWTLSWRCDPEARVLADAHYSRQSPGDPNFVPPGRCLVLKAPGAVWVTSWPYAEWVRHRWAGAWVCSMFRNTADVLSSLLIREAVAATRWRWPDVPPAGMITFVDAGKIRHKRDPGRCFRKAGFLPVGHTKGGLVVLQLLPEDMPDPKPPAGSQMDLFEFAEVAR